MNRILKVVFSRAKGMFVVMSELGRACSKSSVKSVLLTLPLVLASVEAMALKEGNGSGIDIYSIYDSFAACTDDIAIGDEARANGSRSVALGRSAWASGRYAYALGSSASASAEAAYALGVSAVASKTSAYALGNDAKASGESSVALGYLARASESSAYALGSGAVASAGYAYALGKNAKASGSDSYALGSSAVASASLAYALGSSAVASGLDSYAFGAGAEASGFAAYSLGLIAEASGHYAYALGFGALASGSRAFALGSGAKAEAETSIAIGTASAALLTDITDRDDWGVISVGRTAYTDPNDSSNNQAAINRRIINVSSGLNDSDVSTVGQLTQGMNAILGDGVRVEVDSSGKFTVSLDGTDGLGKTGKTTISEAIQSITTASIDLTEINSAIDTNKTNIETVQTSLTDLSSTVGGYGTRLNSHQEILDQHTQSIHDFGVRFTTNEADIAANKVLIDENTKAIEANATAIGFLTENQVDWGNLADNDAAIEAIRAASGSNYFSANISHETLGTDALTTSAKARGAYSIAIGVNAETDASSSIVLGNNAFAWDASTSIAIGKDATISNVAGLYTDGLNGYGNLAFGRSTLVQNGRHNMAIGSGSQVIGNSTSGVMGGMALGMYSKVTGANYGIAIGRNASVDSARAWASIALGEAAVVTGADILSSDKRGVLSVGNSSSGIYRRIINVADGVNDHDAVNMSQLNELRSMIDGIAAPTVWSVRATSVSEGHNTVSVDGNSGLVLQEVSNDQGGTDYVLSLDPNREVVAKSAIFNEGAANQVSINDEGIVVGKSSSVMNKDGFFAGGHTSDTATAYMANGVISAGSDANRIQLDGTAGTVSVGEKIKIDGVSGKITGVAAGEVSSDSTEAVNGRQLYATQQMVSQNASQINQLGRQIHEVDEKVDRAGANAAALAALHPQDYDPDRPYSAAVGMGHYKGRQALAVGMFARPAENMMFSLGASSAGSNDYMVNAGFSYRFGAPYTYSQMTKTAMVGKINDLSDTNRSLQAQLVSANTRLESTDAKLSKLAQENKMLKAEIEQIKKMLKLK